jgi:hypothetical protein
MAITDYQSLFQLRTCFKPLKFTASLYKIFHDFRLSLILFYFFDAKTKGK